MKYTTSTIGSIPDFSVIPKLYTTVQIIDHVLENKIDSYKKSQKMRDNHKHENINLEQVELHHKKEVAQTEWFNKFFNK